jgi:hypothetical protein
LYKHEQKPKNNKKKTPKKITVKKPVILHVSCLTPEFGLSSPPCALGVLKEKKMAQRMVAS